MEYELECKLIQMFGRFFKGKSEFSSEEISKSHMAYTVTHRFSNRYGAIVDVIAQLFCACKTVTVNSKKLLHKIIQHDMNLKAVICIAKHHCWDSLQNTKYWENLIDEGLEKAFTRSEAVKPYMQIFMGLIEMEDSVAVSRIEQAVQFFLNLLKTNLTGPNKDREAFEKLVTVLGKLFENKSFKNCIMKRDHKNKLSNYLTQGGYTLTKPT